MLAGNAFVMIVAWSRDAFGGDALDRSAIVVDLDSAPAWLLEIEKLELLAVGKEIDGFARRFGRHADAAEPVDSVAWRFAHQAFGVPALSRSAANIEAAIAGVGAADERIAAASVAKFFLETISQVACPFISGSVRIAVVKNAKGSGDIALLMPVELLEEGDQRSGVFNRDGRAGGDFLKHSFIGFHANRRADFGRSRSGDAAANGCRDFFGCRFYRSPFRRDRLGRRLADARTVSLFL